MRIKGDGWRNGAVHVHELRCRPGNEGGALRSRGHHAVSVQLAALPGGEGDDD